MLLEVFAICGGKENVTISLVYVWQFSVCYKVKLVVVLNAQVQTHDEL